MITPEVATPQAVFWDVPKFVKLDEIGIFASAEFWMLQSRPFRADYEFTLLPELVEAVGSQFVIKS